MTEQQFLEFLNASPIVALIVGFVIVALAVLKAAPGIQDREIRRLEVLNEGQQQESDARGKSADAAMKAFEVMAQSMRDTMLEQRKFNAERTDNMLTAMRLLEGEMAELKDELRQKDIVIRSQAQRIESLETENAELHKEIDKVRTQMNKDKADARKDKGQAKTVGPAPKEGLTVSK